MLNGHQVIGVTAGEHTVVSLSTGEVIGCGANHNGQLGLFRSFYFYFLLFLGSVEVDDL
jgi:hypothetical protein